jgi:metal-responsive CopG/Arc/MetJ family transcriptional regulator
MITKSKRSITISKTILEELAMLKINMNISQFIDAALIYYITELKKQERAKRDIEIINANINRFNKEAEENLEFQNEL